MSSPKSKNSDGGNQGASDLYDAAIKTTLTGEKFAGLHRETFQEIYKIVTQEGFRWIDETPAVLAFATNEQVSLIAALNDTMDIARSLVANEEDDNHPWETVPESQILRDLKQVSSLANRLSRLICHDQIGPRYSHILGGSFARDYFIKTLDKIGTLPPLDREAALRIDAEKGHEEWRGVINTYAGRKVTEDYIPPPEFSEAGDELYKEMDTASLPNRDYIALGANVILFVAAAIGQLDQMRAGSLKPLRMFEDIVSIIVTEVDAVAGENRFVDRSLRRLFQQSRKYAITNLKFYDIEGERLR